MIFLSNFRELSVWNALDINSIFDVLWIGLNLSFSILAGGCKSVIFSIYLKILSKYSYKISPDFCAPVLCFILRNVSVTGKRGRGRPRKVRLAVTDNSVQDPTADPNIDTPSEKPAQEENGEATPAFLEDGEEFNQNKTFRLSEQENSAAEGLLGLSEGLYTAFDIDTFTENVLI